jgi:hypothetical protein
MTCKHFSFCAATQPKPVAQTPWKVSQEETWQSIKFSQTDSNSLTKMGCGVLPCYIYSKGLWSNQKEMNTVGL